MKTQRHQKGKKNELEGELVEAESKKKKEKVKGPAFEIQEYDFSERQERPNNKFKSRNDLYDNYRKEKYVSSKEYLKLYS